MKKINFYNDFLINNNYISCGIKVSLILLFVVSGFFYQPLMIVACLLGCLFIIFENDINSFYIILFYLPFFDVFTFNNKFGLSYWNIMMIVFVAVIFIKTLLRFIKKQSKFDFKVIIPFVLFIIYAAIPFNGGYSISFFSYFAKTCLWMLLFYLMIQNYKDFKLEKNVLFLIFGIMVAFILGLFKKYIPYINETVLTYYAYDVERFAGLFDSPNMLYGLCILSMAFIHLLTYYNKLNKWWLLLLLPLSVIGILTISKTFLICFLVFIIIISLSYLIKVNKEKVYKFIIAISCIVLSFICVLPYTKTIFSRILLKNNAVEVVVENNEPQEVVVENNEPQEISDDTNVNNDTSINKLTTGRSEIWKAYMKDYLSSGKKIIFGSGGGSSNNKEVSIQSVHNGYLQIIYEYGIIGTLIIFGGFIYLLIHLGYFRKKWFNLTLYIFVLMGLNFMAELLFLAQIWACEVVLSFYFLSFKIDKEIITN